MIISHQRWALSTTLTAKRIALCAILVTTGMQLPQAMAAPKVDFDFYGFIQLDAIYDFDRMNADWKDSLRPSQICTGEPGCGTDGETIFSVRQTRFGVTTSSMTDLGELKTKLEFELYGVGSSAGETTPRLREAYGEIGSFLAGQTWSVFMDIDVFPNTIEYWGPPSMIFWRNLQLRWSAKRGENTSLAIALESPASSVDSGKLNGIDPSLVNIQGNTELPDLTAHVRTDRNWGHAQAAFILRQVGWDNIANAGGEPSGTETGYGINLSGSYKVDKKGTIKAELAYGEAIASYFNDGGIDIAPSGTGSGAEALKILGWLLFYDYYWNDKWSSSIGWAQTKQDNTDGQNDDAFKGNQYGVVNLLHYPTESIMYGAELQYGEYEQKNGVTRDDTRVQFTFKFKF